MTLAKVIKRSIFSNIIGLKQPTERSTTSHVYMQINSNTCQIITKDTSKMLYYMYAQENKHKHIPKIYVLVYDYITGLCFIEREILFPVIKTNKIAEIQKIKFLLENTNRGVNKIADELLDFYYDKKLDHELEFDFGAHWIMQNYYGKLVISDAFTSKRKNILPRF